MTDAAPMIPTLAEALAKRGYDSLTPVQIAVTEAGLEGADLLVSAQTGSGKTVGFGLAIAPTILGDADRFGPAAAPLALVIAPTRELALQVKSELAWLYECAGATVASCVGGMDMRDERRALDRGAHIVVATPGRLRDHITRGSMDMTALRAVVLDEADEMLDLGFREDLEFILGQAPETRRTLMFSATVPRAIAALAQSFQKDAVRIVTAGERAQHADIEYRALAVAAPDAENAIVNVLRFYEAQNAIIFCNTRVMVNRLTTRLSNRAFSVVALSGELSQQERTHALQAMRDGRARVCVATDVAARGIDLPNLELVIHAELPTNADTLLHRSGRTGRAGRKGVSALIVPRNARKKAESLLRYARVTAHWGDAPSAEAVRLRDEERLLADPVWSDPVADGDRDIAARLAALYSPAQLSAAYVRLYKGNRSAPEDLAAPGNDPAQRPAFGPSRWFAVSVGRAQGAEPRVILPMLCRSGNLTRDDVGAIRVQDSETFVEVLLSSADRLLAAVGPEGNLEGAATIRPLAEPPFGARPAVAQPVAAEPMRERPAALRDTVAPVPPARAAKPTPKPKPAHIAPRVAAEHGLHPSPPVTDAPRKARHKAKTPSHAPTAAKPVSDKRRDAPVTPIGKTSTKTGTPKGRFAKGGVVKGGAGKPYAAKPGGAPPRPGTVSKPPSRRRP
jgi:ATP-dependent RNA helicase DeaD